MVREGYSDILTITRVIRAGHKKSWVGGGSGPGIGPIKEALTRTMM